MPAPVIVSVLNTAADGVHLDVTLASAPLGALTFKASKDPRTATNTWAVCPVDSQPGALTYRVAVRSLILKSRIPYYVVALDGGVESNVGCEWIAPGSNAGWEDQVADGLMGVLTANEAAIARAAVLHYGGEKLPGGMRLRPLKIVPGEPGFESDGVYPVLSVAVNQTSEDQGFSSPYESGVEFHGMIACYLVHRSERQWEALMRAMARAAADVLNQPIYLDFFTPSGIQVRKSIVTTLASSETEWKGGDILAQGQLAWQGEALIAREL